MSVCIYIYTWSQTSQTKIINQRSFIHLYINYILICWVVTTLKTQISGNSNISLAWSRRPFGDDSPCINHMTQGFGHSVRSLEFGQICWATFRDIPKIHLKIQWISLPSRPKNHSWPIVIIREMCRGSSHGQSYPAKKGYSQLVNLENPYQKTKGLSDTSKIDLEWPGNARTTRHAPRRKFRKRDMVLLGIHGEVESSQLKWSEMHEMNELTWINWHEWLKMRELKRMNWNEWVVMNELKWKIDMKELKRRTCNAWIDMNDLKRINWHEWIERSDLTWLTWHEGIETNQVN